MNILKFYRWIVTLCCLIVAAQLTAHAQYLRLSQATADPQLRPAQAQASPQQGVSLKCPKCQSEMQLGYIPDVHNTLGTMRGPACWTEGAPDKGILAGLHPSKRHEIEAYRCSNCGYLELYAR